MSCRKDLPEIKNKDTHQKISHKKGSVIEGRIWLILKDNIDTDMIFHNRYLAITDIKEMGQYTFDNLKGFEDFSKKQNRVILLSQEKILAAEAPGSRQLIVFQLWEFRQ